MRSRLVLWALQTVAVMLATGAAAGVAERVDRLSKFQPLLDLVRAEELPCVGDMCRVDQAQAFNDGAFVPAGAHLERPQVVTHRRTVSWWSRGPVRRFLSRLWCR